MTDLSAHVYKDGNKFYFDPENYTGDHTNTLPLDYEDGDMIKWKWENSLLCGTIREEYSNKLFVIKNVTTLQ